MSDNGSSADSTPVLETTEWSANGTHTDRPVAVAEVVEEVAGTDAPADPEPAEAPADATAGAADDDGTAFLSELVRAMQTTASAEKTRIAEDTDRRREAHLATVAARREDQQATMRSLANDDLKAIDVWADEERQRIQAERDRRATGVQTDLQTSLAEHGAKIDREIEAVESAIATYRTEVDAFFSTLDQETDPVAIARHASARPVFPTLEAIGADAAAGESSDAPEAEAVAEATPVQAAAAEDAPAVAETTAEATEMTAEATDELAEAEAGEVPAPVAVMEPRTKSKLAESWAAWSGISAAPASTESETDDRDDSATASEAPAEASAAEAPSEPITLEPAAVVSGKGKVLQTVPSSRPMSWLRRDHDAGDRQNGDH